MKMLALKTLVLLLVTTVAQANNTVEDKKEVNTDKSTVTWKAYKVTGSHTGTVTLKSGNLIFTNEALTGGQFEVNMTTINTTDLTGDSKNNLDGHLKSEDFFSVANNPTATMVFTKVTPAGKNAYNVTGDLTIKGITKPVNFTVSVYGSKATANLKVDRTAFDVKYGSGIIGTAKDKLIYDEFDLVVDLEF